MTTIEQLAATLNTVQIGTPLTAANVTMVPLLQPGSTGGGHYRLLDEALDAGLAEVTEVSEHGAVPELLFRNKSDTDILLVDGEELVGAKQNRVLNLTILVAAGQQVKIPVSCVEAGRWAWQSRRFASGKRKLNARARMHKMRGVSFSMRDSGERSRGDVQQSVWSEIDRKMESLSRFSPGRSMHEVYEASEGDLAPLRAAFKPVAGQVGAAFALDGRLVGIELFDAPATLAKLLPKLVDSYAFDAIERPDRDQAAPATPSLVEVKDLLARIAQAPQASYAAIAKGVDVRIDAPSLHGAALVDGERVVHLSAFDTGSEDREDQDTVPLFGGMA